jgi:hypothetical protein
VVNELMVHWAKYAGGEAGAEPAAAKP